MKKVLLISTSAASSGLITSALGRLVEVETTGTVATALQSHQGNPFDLIFVELGQLCQESATDDFEKASQPFREANPFVRFIVLTDRENVRRAVTAIRQGAWDYLTHPADAREVRGVLESAEQAVSKDMELDYLRDRFWKTEWLGVIRSRNPAMRKVFDGVRSVAPTIATVLLQGETGTGKGLLARLIHWHSLRCDKPFVAVHCGAIPDTLLESELFGHEKGAFTGADRRKLGKFEMARGGTIFLDEIGTVTPSAQIKLLQVLQDGSFSRVGGEDTLHTDARIIAATNANLRELTETGGFRKDLFYRLNIFLIQIPPLRDRLEDLPHLIELFRNTLNAKYGKSVRRIHPDVLEGFRHYDWPGNIRELENILERAAILETADTLGPGAFPPELVAACPEGAEACDRPDREDLTLAEARGIALHRFEKSYIHELLQRNRGRINLSAQKAGITTRQLNRLLTRYGIDKKHYKKG